MNWTDVFLNSLFFLKHIFVDDSFIVMTKELIKY